MQAGDPPNYIVRCELKSNGTLGFFDLYTGLCCPDNSRDDGDPTIGVVVF